MLFKASLLTAIFSALAYAAPSMKSRQACSDVTIIFARGTGETPPIGTVVGPEFEIAVEAAISPKSLSFIGVDYAASIPGFVEGGDPAGARTMAEDVTSAASSCPNTQIVMSGYSQGAQLTHLAAEQISSSVQNRVAAVVVFGDPDNGSGFPGVLNGRSITFCNAGDNICMGGDLILLPHLTYGADAGSAAAFVASHL